jgi:hypothetical protein
MAVKVRTWVWIVIGIGVLGVLCLIAVAGATFYMFTQHVDTKVVSRASANEEFDAIRTRFTGQRALIELDERGHFLRSNTNRDSQPGVKIPDQLYVLAFDPDDGRIVRVKIPFWLLRFKSHGTTIDLDGGTMGVEDLKLTVEDLERFGPTLIVDHQGRHGERVLVWSQ